MPLPLASGTPGGMRVFVTSDHHFGQGGALGLFKRPFEGVEAMDTALIAAWNEVVAPSDRVWHLGDFAITRHPERVAKLLAALHGEKHLVGGNNDGPATRSATGWAGVGDLVELEVGGRLVVLCHYPLRTWNRAGRGAVQLHGHSHGRLKPLPRQLDVGVDAHGFRPLSLEDAVALALVPPSKRAAGG